MPVKYKITSEQQAEIEASRKKNRNKTIEAKLRILSLRAEGKTLKEISEITEYHFTNVSKIISQFIHRGLSYVL
ncbi:helix-turn-helix domain-containing protein, partial [Pyramidobacter sp.]|uniref:helix-turn-helix domain-containing protein n=1 Tax=Pyramidobacter sp. TaxID=1943581 RepID=UPI00332AC4BA